LLVDRVGSHGRILAVKARSGAAKHRTAIHGRPRPDSRRRPG
jgi:hypothetical protein